MSLNILDTISNLPTTVEGSKGVKAEKKIKTDKKIIPKNKKKLTNNNKKNKSQTKSKLKINTQNTKNFSKEIFSENKNHTQISPTTQPQKGSSKSKIKNIIWLSVSEASKVCGVQAKTIRRAIQSNRVKYKVINNRYQINFISIIKYMHANKKLKNKFLTHGLGQYINNWNLEE